MLSFDFGHEFIPRTTHTRSSSRAPRYLGTSPWRHLKRGLLHTRRSNPMFEAPVNALVSIAADKAVGEDKTLICYRPLVGEYSRNFSFYCSDELSEKKLCPKKFLVEDYSEE
ncbi:hypothetical protein CEXT_616461 [Caerostris extrusa]|uniref:Uncharacterized protein n=1 Tax=Caerostris extrusa TaxID=172846 RepID=A0AAV4SZ05_CAEEX|nr:hypothetical protein CEXT_616461 [Caerostris extrusa]